MVATIDEQQMWFSEITNTPIVNGFIHIGDRNGDPRIPIAIFSDRELTTPLSNPQRTDAAGRSINKIWIPGRYSILVTNSNDVTRYTQLDVGESASASVIILGNVQGANDITATGTPTITSYEDLSQFTFRTVQANTDAMTLNVDGIGQIAIVKNKDKPIQPNNFEAAQNIVLSYNLTDNVVEWTNQNIKSVSSYKGADIESASTIVIPTDGDYFEVTGTTTIAIMTIANNRQFQIKVISGFALTNSSSIFTPSGTDLTLTAGQVLTLQSTSENIVQILGGGVATVTTSDGLKDTGTATDPIIQIDSFESAEIPVVLGSEISVAHGLGKIPQSYQILFRCLIAEQGYIVGDEIDMVGVDSTTASRGYQGNATATDIFVRTGSGSIIFLGATFSSVGMTIANWRYVLKAIA